MLPYRGEGEPAWPLSQPSTLGATEAPINERTAACSGTETARTVSLGGLAHAATRSRIVLAGIWLAAILHLAAVCWTLPARVDRQDFSHYYASALAARKGLNPYTLNLKTYAAALGLRVGSNIHATYTPTFVLCFEPLTLLSPRTAYWTWFGINVVFLAAALAMLAGSEPALDARMKSALLAFALLYPPLEVHFYYAQSQIMVLMMLVVMMLALENGRDALAGLTLAAAGLLRGFPLIMAGYLIVRRRWRALAYTAGGLAAGGSVTMLAMGPARAVGFDHAISLITSLRFVAIPANIALRSFVSRLFWYALVAGVGRPFLALRLPAVIAAELVLLALTVRATFAQRHGALRDRSGFALWVAATILLAPTAWIHYMVLLFIPFVAMAAAAASTGLDRRAARAAVASYLGLVIVMIGAGSLPITTPGWLRLVIEEYASVSMLLAYLAVYWLATGE